MSTSDFTINANPELIDLDWLHKCMSTDTYWASQRSKHTVAAAVAGSHCYGAYDVSGAQVGFARIVTDNATFAWLCDVYVDRRVRGEGISKRLVQRVVDDCKAMKLRRIVLATADADRLYSRYGFESVDDDSSTWMSITWPEHL